MTFKYIFVRWTHLPALLGITVGLLFAVVAVAAFRPNILVIIFD